MTIAPLGTPVSRVSTYKPALMAEPQFAGKNGNSDGTGETLAMLALAGLAALAAWKLTNNSKPKTQVTELPNGSLRINEGRGDFVVDHPDLCGNGALIINDKGEQIVFTQTTVARGGRRMQRVKRTIERLDGAQKTKGPIEI